MRDAHPTQRIHHEKRRAYPDRDELRMRDAVGRTTLQVMGYEHELYNPVVDKVQWVDVWVAFPPDVGGEGGIELWNRRSSRDGSATPQDKAEREAKKSFLGDRYLLLRYNLSVLEMQALIERWIILLKDKARKGLLT